MRADNAERDRRVVVTGVGAVTALGVGADILHEAAVAGKTGVVDGVGRCADFDAGGHFTPRESRRMDRFTQLAVVAGAEAMRQAGWTQPPTDPGLVHCTIGTAIGGLISLEQQLDVARSDGAAMVSPLTVPLLMANAAAAHLTRRFGIHGESSAISTACSSGAQAIIAGARAIRAGDADAAVVGGSEAIVTDFGTGMFAAAGALSPSGESVPFDRDRDGFILGEGAGVLVLETEELARRRGATVLAELGGYWATSDGYHLTAPEPSGASATEAVRRALAKAGVGPAALSYINAHGTGTSLNDDCETRALRAALGHHLDEIPISSTKSAIGHLMGAAGAVEAIATIQALRHRTAPPTVGLREPDPALGQLRHVLSAVALDAQEGTCTGLSNSLGFGGHNVALVFQA